MNSRTLITILCVVGGIILLTFVSSSYYTVNPSEQVIITEFGNPVGKPVTEPGMHFKKPFVQTVNYIPKNILPWDGPRNEMPTRDKLYISVNTFARWRITDPLEYFRRLRDERSALSRIEDIIGSETRSAVAKHDLIEIIRTNKDRKPLKDETLQEMTEDVSTNIGVLPPIRRGRHAIEADIRNDARAKLAELGIELLDVRFKRVNYNATVAEKIYERMVSERQQIASKFRSEGQGEAARILGDKEKDLNQIGSEAYKKVQTARGNADAKASEIYARAYGQRAEAAELYEFLKSMEMYRKTIGSESTLVLSTDSDLFKFLKSSDGKTKAPVPAP